MAAPSHAVPAAPLAPTPASGPTSKAPPGFTGSRILAAESTTLLALDPVDDEPDAAAEPTAGPATVGGSALLARARAVVPRRGDHKAFGRDRDATKRVSVAVLVTALLTAIAGPPLGRLAAKVPVLDQMVAQLQSYALYPSAYGLLWFVAALTTVTLAGVVVAQMEKTAHAQGRRRDPVTRLNIALAGVLALTLAAGSFSLLRSHGWAAGAASIGFFASVCLLVPLGNLPGARALRAQPARAWAIVLGVALAGFAAQPSFPTALLVLLTFTHVRTRWAEVRDGGASVDPDAAVDPTNRRSALLIVAFVLIASSVGMNATTLPARDIRPADQLLPTTMPGTERGPTIAPPASTTKP